MLSVENIQFLFEQLDKEVGLNRFSEITFECNPEDILGQKSLLNVLQALPVSRLSVGLQTLSSAGLHVLERQATPDKIEKVADMLESEWKKSLSYDFLAAWPTQEKSHFETCDIEFLKRRHYHHISLYLLSFERGTRMERDRRKGLIHQLSDDDGAELWERWQQVAKEKGLLHYEISNFALPGHESQHNMSTWQGQPYLGLGSGAVSRVGKVRWTNLVTPKLYMDKIQQKRPAAAQAEYLTPEITWQESLFLGLRHSDGLNLDDFNREFGFYPLDVLGDKAQRWKTEGYLSNNKDCAFTEKGWSLFDDLISDWMLSIENHFSEELLENEEK